MQESPLKSSLMPIYVSEIGFRVSQIFRFTTEYPPNWDNFYFRFYFWVCLLLCLALLETTSHRDD